MKAKRIKARRLSQPARGEPAFLCLICHKAFRSGYEVHEHLQANVACRNQRLKLTRLQRDEAQRVNTKLRVKNGWVGKGRTPRAATLNDYVVQKTKSVSVPGLKGWLFCPNCGTDIRKGRTQ